MQELVVQELAVVVLVLVVLGTWWFTLWLVGLVVLRGSVYTEPPVVRP